MINWKIAEFLKTILIFFIFCSFPLFANHQWQIINPFEHKIFESSEHIFMGDKVKLFFSADNTGQSPSTLHLPNGLNLSYGDILSLGDFYEIPGRAISLGKTGNERRSEFLAAFNSFATNPKAVSEAKQILRALHHEQEMVIKGMEQGQDPNEILEKLSEIEHPILNCITGGGCSKKYWWVVPGRYLKLIASDYDHFGENAWIAYSVGHQLAIEQAIRAHQTKDRVKLENAYAMNAFACHFLSDRFASGHIRVPRVELFKQSTPHILGFLLSLYMHHEENIHGLHVHNRRGDRWIAYGDKDYWSKKNQTDARILNETLQLSSNEIFAAYQNGFVSKNNDIFNLLPQPDEEKNASNLDLSPLFYWDNDTKKLMRRKNINHYYDRHWTADWWGLSTFISLTQKRGLPKSAQAEILSSPLKDKAIHAGLITDPDILDYLARERAIGH